MHKYIILFLLCLQALTLSAQKPVIDIGVLGKMDQVDEPAISNDGKFMVYTIRPGVGYASDKPVTFFVRSTQSDWKMELPGRNKQFTQDSKQLVLLQNDSLGLLTLGTTRITYLSGVKSFRLIPHGSKRDLLVYQNTKTPNQLNILDLQAGHQSSYADVVSYQFNEDGTMLALLSENKTDQGKGQSIQVVNISTNKDATVWLGKKADNLLFKGNLLAFIAKEQNGNMLYYWQQPFDHAVELLDDTDFKLNGLLIISGISRIGDECGYIYLNLKTKNTERSRTSSNAIGVDIWSYTDSKLQSQQLKEVNNAQSSEAVLGIVNKRLFRLEENETIISQSDDYLLLLSKGAGDIGNEWNWNKTALNKIYLVSLKDEKKKLLKSSVVMETSNFSFTADSRFILYYDPGQKNYISYSTATGKTINITKSINALWTTYLHGDEPDADYRPIGIAGFMKETGQILIYDQNDIWLVDPSGIKEPINLTNGYGRNHHIAFRVALWQQKSLGVGQKVILNAFNHDNKDNGFFKITLGKQQDPELLTMQPCMFMGPDEGDVNGTELIKAKNAECYLATRQTASDAPNFEFTKDFKTFHPMSNNHPEKQYNWLTSELVTWKTFNGTLSQGILYKPENFDPAKKYPVIFYYYERLSEGVHEFKQPDYCEGPINIPYFVSNGYLLFVPDIHKKIAYAGESAYNAVVSAADYLSTLSYVDSLHMGIQGHSFGGFETNYIITHSKRFAAAISASGMSDFISCYGSIFQLRDGSSRQRQYEIYHDAMGASLWEIPQNYINNSPVLNADKVTTPLLMMNNISDGDVPFAQGVELFTALRRLGKRAWMLQYDGGDHMVNGKQAQDLTIRMKQFFDHYLMVKPAPVWMTKGIPASQKGLTNGYEYDHEIKTPGPGL